MGAIASDERLARRAAGGDARALESIYKRYHEDLYRFCLAMTGNAQDAQDALQNTMLKVLRALPGEQREIKLKPWLYRIARNEAVEVLRRRRDSEELEADVPTIGTVAETAETRERLRELLDDLEQLPERQRAALLMRELSGCDFAEIGEAFGTSPAVARQTLYEARLGLRELAQGRERPCAEVRRELSDGDGRMLRRRRTRAHLRDCPDCRAFQEAIAERERTLAGIAPLPVGASTALLHAVLGGQASGAASAGAGVSGLAETLGASVGPTLATSTALKSVATVAVAVVAVTAADRTGVVDLPLAGGDAPGAARAESHSHAHRASAAEGAADAAKGKGVGGDAQSNTAGGAPAGDAGAEGTQPSEGGSGALSGHPASTPGHRSSEPGFDPPGGGHGKPAGGQEGRPDGPPEAARKGKETASSKKPSDAPGPANPPDVPQKPAKPAPGPPQGSPGPAVTPPAPAPQQASPPEPTPPAKATPAGPSSPPAQGGQGSPSPQGSPAQPPKP